jgi:hypothetical protein
MNSGSVTKRGAEIIAGIPCPASHPAEPRILVKGAIKADAMSLMK